MQEVIILRLLFKLIQQATRETDTRVPLEDYEIIQLVLFPENSQTVLREILIWV